MKLSLRQSSRSVSRSPGAWLALLLLFVVLVPSLGLLWFMNEAVENERLAVRQKLIDVYRAQLGSIQEQLAENWRKRADDLAAAAEVDTPSVQFARLVRNHLADGLVALNSDGAVMMPAPFRSPAPEPANAAWRAAQAFEATQPQTAAEAFAVLAAQTTDTELAARALQAQARNLVRADAKAEALAVLKVLLDDVRYAGASDQQGRPIAPGAGLLAIELATVIDPSQVDVLRERWQALILDYEHVAMPAAQRRFFLRELQRRSPDTDAAHMLGAEELVATYVAAGDLLGHDWSLRPTALPGIWRQDSADGRVRLLHRVENLAVRLRTLVGSVGLPSDLRLEFVRPGSEAETALLSLPAGPELPGWRLAIAAGDAGLFDAATSERVTSYVWIGALVVLTVVVLTLLAFGLLRRQTALTQLRNDLVANVTHELKTPLASMRLLVETLLNTPTLNEQTTREYLQLIAAENLRLSRLIGNFLTFSRIERNKYTFDFKDVSAGAIAENAATAVRDRLQAPGCRFEVDLPADLPRVTADADAITTALVNLLDNAWKYSGDAKEIMLSAQGRNGSVHFTVRDNGIGLSPGDTKRIFARFHQVHGHLSTAGGGCGLGLSIVQFIVEAHRGDVKVESEPGRGSTFTIVLPVTGTPTSRS